MRMMSLLWERKFDPIWSVVLLKSVETYSAPAHARADVWRVVYDAKLSTPSGLVSEVGSRHFIARRKVAYHCHGLDQHYTLLL